MVVTIENPTGFAPALPAIEPAWAHAARESPALFDIAHAVGGGPFHVIHPATFGENLQALARALATEGVDGTVYYGKKANKASAWITECARPGAGVDVASVPELVAALAGGVRGTDIGVTGAAKPDELLWLALRHDCLIAVDEDSELDRLATIATRHDARPRILLRLRPPTAPTSRFGFGHDVMDETVRRCASLPVDLCGFSFHLDGYAAAPRAELAWALVERCLQARSLGHRADRISIGGGFACAYVDEEDWRAFEDTRVDAWFHAEHNPARTYPYFQSPTGAAMLTAILRHRGADVSLARALRDSDIRLLVEPGRALVHGAGFSVFPVLGCKDSPAVGTTPAHAVTTVAGLSMSVSEQWKGSEYLPDPILVTAPGPRPPSGPIHTAVGGSSCMEYDVLTWRAVRLSTRPQPGDLLVYPATAGYQMDKNESGFHELPLPPKVVWDDAPATGGRPRWRLDAASTGGATR